MGILERNTNAFDSKLEESRNVQKVAFFLKENEKIHSKGCNCKKSGCLKKYCECFLFGVKCTRLCKCEGC